MHKLKHWLHRRKRDLVVERLPLSKKRELKNWSSCQEFLLTFSVNTLSIWSASIMQSPLNDGQTGKINQNPLNLWIMKKFLNFVGATSGFFSKFLPWWSKIIIYLCQPYLKRIIQNNHSSNMCLDLSCMVFTSLGRRREWRKRENIWNWGPSI